MSDWERPPLPTEGEKSRLIAAAVEAALPPRASAPARLSRTLHALGLPMLFFGMADCLFLAVAATLACLAPVGYVAAHEGQLAPLLFLFSPFLYAALTLLSLWKERMDGTWEWRRSCRLPFRAVAALRMLVFGAASAAASVAANLWLWACRDRRPPWQGCSACRFPVCSSMPLCRWRASARAGLARFSPRRPRGARSARRWRRGRGPTPLC